MKKQRINWQPYRIGLAIFAALLSATLSVIILISSNNHPVDSWVKVRPTVLLAICTVVANVTVGQVLSEGLPIRWWLEAKHSDGSVDDLRRVYAHGSSAWDSICSFCIAKPTTAATACLAAASVALNGPLLQRASHVGDQLYTKDVEITTNLAAEWPMGFSGIKNPRTLITEDWVEGVQAFTPEFANVVKDFSARKDISLNDTGCIGTCAAMVKGAGFALDCSEGNYDYNITVDANAGHAVYVQAAGFSSGLDLFMPANSSETATIKVNTLFKNSEVAAGKGTTRSCNLSPSTVLYSVLLTNSTVSLVGTMRDDTAIKPSVILEYAATGRSTLGGLVLAGWQKYNSTAKMLWQGSLQWSVPMTGSLAYEFQNIGELSPEVKELGISAAMTWSDPTEVIIQGMRELMFRSAIVMGDSSNPPSVSRGSMVGSQQIYKTDFLFMGLGVGAIVIGILGMIPLLWGGWALREDVSLDPICAMKWATELANNAKQIDFPQFPNAEYVKIEVEDKR